MQAKVNMNFKMKLESFEQFWNLIRQESYSEPEIDKLFKRFLEGFYASVKIKDA